MYTQTETTYEYDKDGNLIRQVVKVTPLQTNATYPYALPYSPNDWPYDLYKITCASGAKQVVPSGTNSVWSVS